MPVHVSYSGTQFLATYSFYNGFLSLTRKQVHMAFQKQATLFNHLLNCQDLWEQADNLVIRGNHTGSIMDNQNPEQILIFLFPLF